MVNKIRKSIILMQTRKEYKYNIKDNHQVTKEEDERSWTGQGRMLSGEASANRVEDSGF